LAAENAAEIVMDPMTTKSYSLLLWHDLFSVWRYVRPISEWVMQLYHDVPTGYRVVDRSLCITTGYVLLVIGGSMYLSRSRPIYATIGRTARQIIRQLGLFLKVSLFIWIEVIFFPIGCGLLLDLVALCMFYQISGEGHLIAIHKRMLFLKENVTSSIFIHWIVGTTCIFILTSMVSFCRDNVRPGVFWFMRDPNDDPNPLKELVERSVTSQLQKTLASSLLYGFVIEFGIGGLIVIIGTLFEDIFPLKWSYR
jgi:E3 ubiquitin-protein ligase DOA10